MISNVSFEINEDEKCINFVPNGSVAAGFMGHSKRVKYTTTLPGKTVGSIPSRPSFTFFARLPL